MQWMVKCYDRALYWSQHAHAPRYLALVSLIEASFFPIPPYFMLAPMVLAKPGRARDYALIATIASVCGGVIGYFLGYLIFKPVVLPVLEYFNQVPAYEHVLAIFKQHGFWALLVLGVTPVPYKFIAIGAGFLFVPLHWFIAASILSRGLKFFGLALLVKAGGANMEGFLRTQIQRYGMLAMGICGVFLLVCLKVVK